MLSGAVGSQDLSIYQHHVSLCLSSSAYSNSFHKTSPQAKLKAKLAQSSTGVAT